LGEQLAALLEKGSIVALKGHLGAGKTCLVKGIARGLGIEETLRSPSYTVVFEYETGNYGEKTPVYHIDAYRLEGNEDFSAIGGKDMVFGNGISLIEWSDHIPSFIPAEALRVDIEIAGDDERRFHIYYGNTT
jgi:tRNA threonylcarbamoyladenosine biosynthesis protein TsaE